MELPDLQPDCSACAALCWVVFAFDRSESFAADKAAGEVCGNLRADDRCGIFSERERRGYRGCVVYDCHGAGQVVSRDIFKGRSWRDDPSLTHRMGAALSVLRRIHENHMLLDASARLPLDGGERETLAELREGLTPEAGWTEAGLASFPLAEHAGRVAVFLKSLRRHAETMRGAPQ